MACWRHPKCFVTEKSILFDVWMFILEMEFWSPCCIAGTVLTKPPTQLSNDFLVLVPVYQCLSQQELDPTMVLKPAGWGESWKCPATNPWKMPEKWVVLLTEARDLWNDPKGTVSYSETCMMLDLSTRPFHCPRYPILSTEMLGFHPLVEIYSSIYMSCVICKKQVLHKKQVFIWLFL